MDLLNKINAKLLLESDANAGRLRPATVTMKRGTVISADHVRIIKHPETGTPIAVIGISPVTVRNTASKRLTKRLRDFYSKKKYDTKGSFVVQKFLTILTAFMDNVADIQWEQNDKDSLLSVPIITIYNNVKMMRFDAVQDSPMFVYMRDFINNETNRLLSQSGTVISFYNIATGYVNNNQLFLLVVVNGQNDDRQAHITGVKRFTARVPVYNFHTRENVLLKDIPNLIATYILNNRANLGGLSLS